jgi:hypothetical protein
MRRVRVQPITIESTVPSTAKGGASYTTTACIDAGGYARVSCLDASADGLCGGGLMGYADTFDGLSSMAATPARSRRGGGLELAGRGGAAPVWALF